jgi:DNA-binding CsgD family transcriptional regulator
MDEDESPVGRLTIVELEGARRAFAELRAVASQIPDPAVRTRVRDLGDRLLTAIQGPGAVGLGAELTAREIDVLAHAAIGYRNAEIAERLAVSTETVKSYLRSALDKLGAHSRHGAVSAARVARRLP